MRRGRGRVLARGRAGAEKKESELSKADGPLVAEPVLIPFCGPAPLKRCHSTRAWFDWAGEGWLAESPLTMLYLMLAVNGTTI